MKASMMDEETKELLSACIGLIDMGAQGGAWAGEELEGVGRLRTAIKGKLNDGRSEDEQVSDGEEQG